MRIHLPKKVVDYQSCRLRTFTQTAVGAVTIAVNPLVNVCTTIKTAHPILQAYMVSAYRYVYLHIS